MEFRLPNSVIGHSDITRLQRELEALDDFFTGAKKRSPGAPQATPPRPTSSLDQLARDNSLNLLEAGDRGKLQAFLTQLLETAPQLHISFASEPSPQGLDSILVWFRANIHPYALLQIGLQPSIAAGCVLRTNNRVFDMSLRSHLEDQQPYMVQLIQNALRGGKTPQAAQTTQGATK